MSKYTDLAMERRSRFTPEGRPGIAARRLCLFLRRMPDTMRNHA